MKKTFAIILVLAIFLSFASCKKSAKSNKKDESDYSPGQGIVLTDIVPYTGKYVEDGSNDDVENIASVCVSNNAEKAWQYLDLEVKTKHETYEFELTTLPPKGQLDVLEKNRKKFKKNEKILSVEIKKCVEFTEAVSQHRDEFHVSIMDSVMNIKNVSEKDVNGTIFVYYKNLNENGRMNGITYRVRYDGLKAGELKQMASKNLSKENSKVVFIKYAD